MATNFYHTKTACLACIGGQFHQLTMVNKICRSPKTRGKIGRQKKKKYDYGTADIFEQWLYKHVHDRVF